MATSVGRGRNVNNKPAWMVKKEKEEQEALQLELATAATNAAALNAIKIKEAQEAETIQQQQQQQQQQVVGQFDNNNNSSNNNNNNNDDDEIIKKIKPTNENNNDTNNKEEEVVIDDTTTVRIDKKRERSRSRDRRERERERERGRDRDGRNRDRDRGDRDRGDRDRDSHRRKRRSPTPERQRRTRPTLWDVEPTAEDLIRFQQEDEAKRLKLEREDAEKAAKTAHYLSKQNQSHFNPTRHTGGGFNPSFPPRGPPGIHNNPHHHNNNNPHHVNNNTNNPHHHHHNNPTRVPPLPFVIPGITGPRGGPNGTIVGGPGGGGGGPPLPEKTPEQIQMEQTKHARKLYIGNLGDIMDETHLRNFFHDVIHRAMKDPTGDPKFGQNQDVLDINLNKLKHFAFIELRTVRLTDALHGLDGIPYQGQPLRIRRASDYDSSKRPIEEDAVPELLVDRSALGIIATTVEDGPNKLFVGGIPHQFTDDEVKAILEVCGKLKAFHLVRDAGAKTSKGYAFCEFTTTEETMVALQQLNDLELSEERKLTVKKATPGYSQNAAEKRAQQVHNMAVAHGTANAYQPQQQGIIPNQQQGSRVMCLSNIIADTDELQNDVEYYDILEDIYEKCKQYGKVISIRMPRLNTDGSDKGLVKGLGDIYVEYESAIFSQSAILGLQGSSFDNQTVQAVFYSEQQYRLETENKRFY